ncbi:MAG: hypothetical protein H6584_06620 [Flavobacteriales bacterium]|nr:hypothetical protein [Flavobacteriales bacterium]
MKYPIVYYLLCVVLVSCYNQAKKQDESQQSIYPVIVEKWGVVTEKLDPNAQHEIENWTELKLLQLELTEKPQATLGSIRQKTEILSQKTSKVSETIPETLTSNELISRLKMLYSNIKMLDTQADQDYLNEQLLKEYSEKVVQSFNQFQKQLERQVLKKDIKFEQGAE